MHPEQDNGSAPDCLRTRFLEDLLADDERGRRRPVSHYRQRYPAIADFVTEEYAALCADDDEGASTEAEPLQPGRTWGRYRITAELGRGGMGMVYRAVDPQLGRACVLKVLHPAMALDQGAKERLRREARVLAGLHHARLAGITDVAEEGDQLALVLPLYEGETLAAKIAAARERGAGGSGAWVGIVPGQDRAASLRTLLAYFQGAAEGLAAAHSIGVVHRDIKPDNLLVNAQGKAVLLDFGLAFLEGEERFTSPGELLGTPLYMAPESIEHGCFDARSDVYALGLSLYEAVTLSHPFGGSETRAQTFQQVLADRIPDARSQQPLLSRDAAAVLMRAVERDPKDRYGSAAEFAEDLRRLLDLEPTKARPVSGVGAAWRRVRRRPRLAVLLTVLALTMLGLLVLLDENRELRDGIAAAGRDLMQGDAAQASRRLEELMRSADGLVGQPGVHAIHPRGDTPALDRLQWLGNESVGPATGPYAHRYRVTVQRDGVEVFRGEHRQPHGVVWCELALPDSLREMSGADGWTWRVEWLDDGRKVPEDLHATMLADPVGRRMVLAEAAFTIVPFEQRGFDPRDGSVAAERVRALIDAGYASRALSLLMRAADDGELPRARRLELQATAAAALGDEWLERASRAALEGR